MKNSNENSNEVKKFNLMNLAKELTKETLKSRSSKKSMNDYLLDVLLDKRKSKDEVVEEILVARLIDKHTEEELSKLPKDELLKLMRAERKTVSNGFDTSTCDGKNNSVFRFNPEYSKYELTKHEDKTYSIKLK